VEALKTAYAQYERSIFGPGPRELIGSVEFAMTNNLSDVYIELAIEAAWEGIERSA
jgi:hypothetical protein